MMTRTATQDPRLLPSGTGGWTRHFLQMLAVRLLFIWISTCCSSLLHSCVREFIQLTFWICYLRLLSITTSVGTADSGAAAAETRDKMDEKRQAPDDGKDDIHTVDTCDAPTHEKLVLLSHEECNMVSHEECNMVSHEKCNITMEEYDLPTDANNRGTTGVLDINPFIRTSCNISDSVKATQTQHPPLIQTQSSTQTVEVRCLPMLNGNYLHVPEYGNHTQQESSTQTQVESFRLTQEESSTQTKIERFTLTQNESSTQTQVGSFTLTQNESSTQTQVGSFTLTQNESSTQTQVGSFTLTQNESSKQTQVGSFTLTQNESSKQTQVGSFTLTQNESSKQTQVEIFTLTQKESSTQTQVKSFTLTQKESISQTQVERFALTTEQSSTQTQVESFTLTQEESSTQTQVGSFRLTQEESSTQTQVESFRLTQEESSTQTQVESFRLTQEESSRQTQADIFTQTEEIRLLKLYFRDRLKMAADTQIRKIPSLGQLTTNLKPTQISRLERGYKQNIGDMNSFNSPFRSLRYVPGRQKKTESDTGELAPYLRCHHEQKYRYGYNLVTVGMVKRPKQPPTGSSKQDAAAQQPSRFASELDRLRTFRDYVPPEGVFILPVAASGFFLSQAFQNRTINDNVNDKKREAQASVECAFCRLVVVVSALKGRQAHSLHAALSPSCGFVQGKNVGNVSVASVGKLSSADFFHKYSQPASPQSASFLTEHVTASPRASVAQTSQVASALVTDDDGQARDTRHPLQGGRAWGDRPQENTPRTSQPHIHVPNLLASNTDPSTFIAPQTARANQHAESQTATANQHAGSHRTIANQHQVRQTATANQLSAGQTATTNQQAASQTTIANQQGSSHRAPSNQPQNLADSVLFQTATVSTLPAVSDGPAPQQPPAPSSSDSSPQVGGQSAASSAGTTAGRDEPRSAGNGQDRQLVTYEQLGIYAQRPKRPDMVVTQVRVNTFDNWPRGNTHQPQEMAEAGFYYTGHEDLVRCFYCKSGLKNWEPSDRPWIEHSRWFPHCPFIKLCKGAKFVQAVQNLNDPNSRTAITQDAVLTEVRRLEQTEANSLEDHVRLLDNRPGQTSSGDPNHEALATVGFHVAADVTEASMQEMAERLREDNEQLVSSTMCKMCHNNNVQVLFLPCGHLVACAQCAPAIRNCAICRQLIKGNVRVRLDETKDSEELWEAHGSAGDARHTSDVR